MPIKNNIFKFLILFLTPVILLNSCKKSNLKCTGNCTSITISGNILNKATGTGLSNVPLELKWSRRTPCLICPPKKIATTVSGNDGKFTFAATIDTSNFTDYSLLLSIPADTNYVLHADNNGFSNLYEKSFNKFDPASLQNISFEQYPKTNLTLKIRRTFTDSFLSFSVARDFTNELPYTVLHISGQQYATDTILNLLTSTDIYTKITWQKVSVPGQPIIQTDSLICTKNGTNTYTINY